MADSARPPIRTRLMGLALFALMLWLVKLDWDWRAILRVQPAGIDFAPLWTGARVAASAPARLYDFDYLSALQGWPLGHDHPRPFVYPPSALPVFAPFALLPYWTAYGLWIGLTGAAYAWAGRKAGAPWWFLVLPWVSFTAICGQTTFLLGALTLGGLILDERRPAVAGVLFGLAIAVKPQGLLLLPLALAAQGRWRALASAAAVGLALCLFAAAVWGLGPWRAWLAALPRFQALVLANPGLVRNAITPYAALVQHGAPGAWALVLAPFAALWVWIAFRRKSPLADRLIALVGGGFLISPYAMNYEMALLAPAAGVYLARTFDWRWPLYAAAAYAQSRSYGTGLVTLAPALSLPLLRRLPSPRAFFKS